jgi:RHS repeat-associated protein
VARKTSASFLARAIDRRTAPASARPALASAKPSVPTGVQNGTSGSSYNMLAGTNTFYVHACNNAVPPVCTSGSATITHPPLGVAPKGGATQASPNLVDTSQSFYVSNYMTGTATDTLTLTCSGSGISNCSVVTTIVHPVAGTPLQVPVTYNTAGPSTSGTIKLKARANGFSDSATVTITVAYANSLHVSTATTNQDDQAMSRCAANCFANIIAKSTPAYISRDVARAVGLVYNSAHVTVRPILAADVSFSASYAVQEVELSAQYYNKPTSSWLNVTFFNSDAQQVLHFNGATFAGSTQPFRIGGQFDASAFAVDGSSNGGQAVYPLRLTVTAIYSGNRQEQVIDSTHHLLVINARSSPVANGWTMAGVSTHNWGIPPSPDQSYIVETDGDGSARLYGPVACPSNCVWPSPAGASIDNYFQYTGQPYSEVDYPDSSKALYHASGLLWMRIGRLNDTVEYGYDSQNRVDSITDPYRFQPDHVHHTYWEITYGSNGISSIIEPDTDGTPGHGRPTTFTVNSSHFLTAWTDPDSGTTRFSYDAVYQRLDSLWDRNNNLTTFVYDTVSGALTQVISPPVAIDDSSKGPTHTHSRPLTTTYSTWQLAGIPRSPTTDSLLATPVAVSAILGSVTTPAGQTSSFTADRWGQALIAVDAAGDTTKYGRDANGFATMVVHPSGRIDQYVYSGPFLTSSTPAGLNATNYKYGPYGQVDTISSIGAPTQAFFISTSTRTRGHVDSMAVAGHLLMKYLADTLGRDTTAIDTLGHATVYRYDGTTGNRNVVLAQASGRSTSWTFDGHGRTQTVSQTGPQGTITLSTTYYDVLNRVDSVSDGVHSTKMKYAYDRVNDTAFTDQNGNRYRTAHNALGWATSQTDPANRTITTTYNRKRLPATVTNRRLQLSNFYYDTLSRLVGANQQTSYGGQLDSAAMTTYTNHNLTVTTSNGIETEAKWFSAGSGLLDSTVTAIHNARYRRIYGYDGNGRRISDSVVVSSGGPDLYMHKYYWNATFGYLDSLQLINPTNRATSTVKFHYNAEFMLDQTTYPSSVVRYDTTSQTHVLLSSTWQNLGLYRGYGYDSTGRLTEEDINTRQIGDSLRLFTYDNLGELVSQQKAVWHSNPTCQDSLKKGYGCGSPTADSVVQTQSYTFDATGNLDSLKVGTADTVAALASANRLTGWTGSTFAVDSDGNRLSTTIGSNTTKYVWEANGQLAGDTVGATNRQYLYDARGRLTRRQTNGHTDRYYLWDDDQLVAILDSSAKSRISEFFYLGTDQPLARITDTSSSTDSVHFYAQDALGNVFAQFKGTTVEDSLKYEPWGAATTNDTTQPLRWKGLLYEGGPTSLYYVRARWYDAVTRRFISPDPLGLAAGINQYAFAGGDPINGSDPSGMTCADADESGDCPMGGEGVGGGTPGLGIPQINQWTAGTWLDDVVQQNVACSILLACSNSDISQGMTGCAAIPAPYCAQALGAARGLANINPLQSDSAAASVAADCISVGNKALSGIFTGQISYGGLSVSAYLPVMYRDPNVDGPGFSSYPHIYLYQPAFMEIPTGEAIAHSGYYAYLGGYSEGPETVLGQAMLGADNFGKACQWWIGSSSN